MKGNRYLDESLPDFLLSVWRSSPHVLQDLMSVEEFALVE